MPRVQEMLGAWVDVARGCFFERTGGFQFKDILPFQEPRTGWDLSKRLSAGCFHGSKGFKAVYPLDGNFEEKVSGDAPLEWLSGLSRLSRLSSVQSGRVNLPGSSS